MEIDLKIITKINQTIDINILASNTKIQDELRSYFKYFIDLNNSRQFTNQLHYLIEIELKLGNRDLNILNLETKSGLFAYLATQRGHQVTSIDYYFNLHEYNNLNEFTFMQMRNYIYLQIQKIFNIDYTSLELIDMQPIAVDNGPFDLIFSYDYSLHEPAPPDRHIPWTKSYWEYFINETMNKIADHGLLFIVIENNDEFCLLYTSPSPRDQRGSRMPSSA